MLTLKQKAALLAAAFTLGTSLIGSPAAFASGDGDVDWPDGQTTQPADGPLYGTDSGDGDVDWPD